MAQGTGAQRFLAPSAKAASTRAILVLAAAALLGLAGCGGDSDDQSSTEATVRTPAQGSPGAANISFASPDLVKTKSVPVLPATYTCDGKDIWPTFSWSGFPEETEELILIMVNAKPVNGKIFFDWAVTGLDPRSGGMEAGKLPAGAVMGKNSIGKVGYSICPPKGRSETFMLALYAVPRALRATRGFDPLALREEVQSVSRNSGLYAVSYKR
jgi:phosphatidylethanolamine-binding protein (PEBP) family uncharacterized protein